MEILILIVPVLFFTTNTLKFAKDIHVYDNMILHLDKPDLFSENSMFTENHGTIKMKLLVILYKNYL